MEADIWLEEIAKIVQGSDEGISDDESYRIAEMIMEYFMFKLRSVAIELIEDPE